MERDNTKLEKLIRKQLLDTITQPEEIELTELKKNYTETAYDLMVIEVLRQLEDQLPKDTLDDWEPDYNRIKKQGKERRIARKIRLFSEIGYAAGILLFIGSILLYVFYPKQKEPAMLLLEGQCTNVADDTEIPLMESSCFLLSTDSTWVKVKPDKFGAIMQLGDLAVTRTKEGLLQIQRKQVTKDNTSTLKSLEIYTEPQQQCVVELEDGTRIRMNAQSRLSYPLVKQDSMWIYLKGEAYVDARKRYKNAPLVIGTERGEVLTMSADFLVRSDKYYTKTMLNVGRLDLYARNLKKVQALTLPGDLGFVETVFRNKNKFAKDTIGYVGDQHFESAKNWVRKIRVYKEIPLRVFVDEMSRWEGFKVTKTDCLPKDKCISVAICYRSGPEEVFAAIRQAGVLLYEERGMISFCPEDKHDRVAMRPSEYSDQKLK
jgi:hypothetical protein